jgi:hypothetical protein
MDYVVKYDQENDIIIGSFSGDFDIHALNQYSNEIVKLTKEHNCKKTLNDLRNANINLSITDIFFTIKKLKKNGLEHLWKRALIVSKKCKKLSFFEMISTNRGHKVGIFHSTTEAMDWLKGSQ